MRITRRRSGAVLAAAAPAVTACGGDGDTPTDGDDEATGSEDTGSEDEGDTEEEEDDTEGEDGGEAAPELETVTEGTLTVCTDSPYPPMEFEEDGEFTGFDIELMRAISEQLELETAVVNTGFDPIVSGTALAAGECDIAAASISITEERQESVAFTEPYFDAEQSLLVPTDAGISSLEDLEGESLGVQSGTTGEDYANENVPEGVEVVAFDAPDALFVALEAGEISGILQDLVVNQGRTLEDDSVEVVETYPTDESYGFAAEQDNTELTDAVSEALETVRDEGTYDELRDEFFEQGGDEEE